MIKRISIFLLLLLILPAAVRGHTFPHRCDPKPGSTVQAAPANVRIWFDGDLEPAFSSMSVADQKGGRVDKNDSRVDASDPTLLQVSIGSLAPGTYKVIWKVASRDGHNSSGDYTFTVK